MSQVHVWPNHVRVPHLDLLRVRPRNEPIALTLLELRRLGLDVRPENVVVHLEERRSGSIE